MIKIKILRIKIIRIKIIRNKNKIRFKKIKKNLI